MGPSPWSTCTGAVEAARCSNPTPAPWQRRTSGLARALRDEPVASVFSDVLEDVPRVWSISCSKLQKHYIRQGSNHIASLCIHAVCLRGHMACPRDFARQVCAHGSAGPRRAHGRRADHGLGPPGHRPGQPNAWDGQIRQGTWGTGNQKGCVWLRVPVPIFGLVSVAVG